MKITDIRNYLNKILLFIKPGETTYWNSITECSISSKPTQIPDYYLNFISKADYPGRFDDYGIPLYSRDGLKYFYHPIVIAQYALGLYMKMNSSEMESGEFKNKFLVQADWLSENYILKQKIPVWEINYDIPEYNLYAPWVSAMAQGEVISVLVRAHLIKEENKYLNIAFDAIKIFNIDVKDGGIAREFNGNKLYEEYPSKLKPVGVLNGFIFSLFGIYDLVLSGNKSAVEFFNSGSNSLLNLLELYDMDYWSQYYFFDYPDKYPASYTYHCIAIEQLRAMYFITGNAKFKLYAEKWERYRGSFFKRLKVLSEKIMGARKLA